MGGVQRDGDLTAGVYAGCGKVMSSVSLMPSMDPEFNMDAPPSASRARASRSRSTASLALITGHNQLRRLLDSDTMLGTYLEDFRHHRMISSFGKADRHF